jgi:hypothetical protein
LTPDQGSQELFWHSDCETQVIEVEALRYAEVHPISPWRRFEALYQTLYWLALCIEVRGQKLDFLSLKRVNKQGKEKKNRENRSSCSQKKE